MLKTIPKQSGDSFTLKKGQYLKVIDIKGEQVSDLVVFDAENHHEKLSAGKSMDFEESILLTTGNYLWHKGFSPKLFQQSSKCLKTF